MQKILIVSSLSSTFIATYFWIRCPLWASPKSIAQDSATYLGYNPNKVRSTSSQNADSIVAFILLASSFLFQTISYFLSVPPISGNSVLRICDVWIFLLTLLLFYFIGNCASRKIEQNIYKRTLDEIEKLIKEANKDVHT